MFRIIIIGFMFLIGCNHNTKKMIRYTENLINVKCRLDVENYNTNQKEVQFLIKGSGYHENENRSGNWETDSVKIEMNVLSGDAVNLVCYKIIPYGFSLWNDENNILGYNKQIEFWGNNGDTCGVIISVDSANTSDINLKIDHIWWE
jgi:hypothetical protein